MKSSTKTFLAHAKVNLCLHVLGKRADGYHDVAMLMQQVGLADRVRIRVAEAGDQATGPFGAAKFIGEHPPGHAVEQSQRGIAVGNVVETAPRHEECLCEAISGRLGIGAATAVGVDLTMMPGEQAAIALLRRGGDSHESPRSGPTPP